MNRNIFNFKMSFDLLSQYVKERQNIFLTGQAGTGKSYLINKLKEETRDISMSITSTTGISAYLIKGSTIHSYSGIGVINFKHTIKDILKKISKNKPAKKRIIECDILVIDEISMLGKSYFEMINETFKIIRNCTDPFGGVCLILTGDFMQLAPINDDYVFESNAWTELNLKTIKLEKVYRQDDEVYKGILSRVRLAQQTDKDNIELFKRVKAYKEISFDDLEIKPTFLTSKRVDVDQMNKDELGKNPNELFIYKSADEQHTVFDTNLDLIAPQFLSLKVNAQVMLTVNINVENGMTNGSRGIVTQLTNDNVFVKFRSGETIPFEKHEFKFEEDNKVVATRHQFPFILAYSTSIYKSQGSTLDMAVIDLGYSVFGNHSVYVALSRVKSLDGLFLKAYVPQKITVDERVTDFIKMNKYS